MNLLASVLLSHTVPSALNWEVGCCNPVLAERGWGNSEAVILITPPPWSVGSPALRGVCCCVLRRLKQPYGEVHAIASKPPTTARVTHHVCEDILRPQPRSGS